MTSYAVPAAVARDNTGSFSQVAGVHETNAERRLNLIIEAHEGRFQLCVQSDGTLFDPFAGPWQDDLPLTAEQLWGAVACCRDVWRREAVDRQRGNVYLLQRDWDLSAASFDGLLAELLPPLALAGSELFSAIFFPSKRLADPASFARLGAIGECLRQASFKPEQMWIRVTSDDFYAPWNLLYTRPLDPVDGHDAELAGFWGYQNLIEHVPLPPTPGQPVNRGQELKFTPPLNVALHLDANIDANLKVDCVAGVRTQLRRYAAANGLQVVERNQSVDLARAFSQGALDQHVIYFCCHAQTEGDSTALRIDKSYLALTDNQNHITPGKLGSWLGQKLFLNGPIVFLNACQTGQMNSVFYQGFVPTFLDRKASAVIGTQTEVPACFAGEFARRFFECFFRGGVSVGQAIWNLRREMLDKHRNPLGLLYSVYRGADIRLPQPLPGS